MRIGSDRKLQHLWSPVRLEKVPQSGEANSNLDISGQAKTKRHFQPSTEGTVLTQTSALAQGACYIWLGPI